MVLGLLQGLLHQVRDHWAPILWLNLPLDLHVRRHLRPGRRLSVLLGLVLILAWIGQELWVDQWRTQEAESGGLGWLAVGPGLLWTGAVLLQTGHPHCNCVQGFTWSCELHPFLPQPALLHLVPTGGASGICEIHPQSRIHFPPRRRQGSIAAQQVRHSQLCSHDAVFWNGIRRPRGNLARKSPLCARVEFRGCRCRWEEGVFCNCGDEESRRMSSRTSSGFSQSRGAFKCRGSRRDDGSFTFCLGSRRGDGGWNSDRDWSRGPCALGRHGPERGPVYEASGRSRGFSSHVSPRRSLCIPQARRAGGKGVGMASKSGAYRCRMVSHRGDSFKWPRNSQKSSSKAAKSSSRWGYHFRKGKAEEGNYSNPSCFIGISAGDFACADGADARDDGQAEVRSKLWRTGHLRGF